VRRKQQQTHWTAPVSPTRRGNFFHHQLKGRIHETSSYCSDVNCVTAHAQRGERDLAPEEKKVIMDAVAPSLRNPGSAKYHWAKFPEVVIEDSVNYCATVDAQSPYAAYNGRQAYIVKAQVSGNRVSSAVIGLITGGKDFAIVTNMCAKYGLDPRSAS
jgi:hypothetical protein